jgi:hypothetical protein
LYCFSCLIFLPSLSFNMITMSGIRLRRRPPRNLLENKRIQYLEKLVRKSVSKLCSCVAVCKPKLHGLSVSEQFHFPSRANCEFV